MGCVLVPMLHSAGAEGDDAHMDRFDESSSTFLILRYFLRHRTAADTYEGIVRWRLREETIRQTTEETMRALDWLVERGYIRMEPVLNGAPLFRLDEARAAEAEALLQGKP